MPTSVTRKRFTAADSQPMELPPVMVCIPDLPESTAGGSDFMRLAVSEPTEAPDTSPSSLLGTGDTHSENAALDRPRNQKRRRSQIAIWNHWITKAGVGAALLLALLLVFFVFGRNDPGEPVVDANSPMIADDAAGPSTPPVGSTEPVVEVPNQLDSPTPRPVVGEQHSQSSQVSAGKSQKEGPAAAPSVSAPGTSLVEPGNPSAVADKVDRVADTALETAAPPFPKAPDLGPALTGPQSPQATEPPQAKVNDRPFPARPAIVGADPARGSGAPLTAECSNPGNIPGREASSPTETRPSPDPRATAGTGGPAIPGTADAARPDDPRFAVPPFAEVPPPREQPRQYPRTGMADRTVGWPPSPADDWRGGPRDTGGDQWRAERPAPSPYPTTATPEPYGFTGRRPDPYGQGGMPTGEAAGQMRDSRFGDTSAPATRPQYPMTANPSLDYLKSRVAGTQPAFRTSMRPSPTPSAGTVPPDAAPRVGEAQLRGFIEPSPMRPRYE
jgi:hypothetical protein